MLVFLTFVIAHYRDSYPLYNWTQYVLLKGVSQNVLAELIEEVLVSVFNSLSPLISLIY